MVLFKGDEKRIGSFFFTGLLKRKGESERARKSGILPRSLRAAFSETKEGGLYWGTGKKGVLRGFYPQGNSMETESVKHWKEG